MRDHATRVGLLAVILVGLAATPGSAANDDLVVAPAPEVRVEYIAHAAFVIESPGGTRVAVDPYNGNNWLGYSFPHGLEADAVVVTHPHFDHDATYYFSDVTPVFRAAGEYRVGDVTLRGVDSEHAGRARFLDRGQAPLNTFWIIETGGLRIAHLGDSRLLNELDLEAMGEVDVLLAGAAYFDDPNVDMLTLLLDSARPQVVIPMHYRHHEITELPRGMRPLAEYMRNREPLYLEGNVAAFDPDRLGEWPQIVVLEPSSEVEPWSDTLHDAWIEATEGVGLMADSETEIDEANAEEALWEALFHFEAAMDLVPTVLRFGYGAGDALARLGRVDEAIETLDHALARAPRGDWTDRIRVHMLLGELYEAGGRNDIAIEHYAYVAAREHTHETGLREQAVERLAQLR